MLDIQMGINVIVVAVTNETHENPDAGESARAADSARQAVAAEVKRQLAEREITWRTVEAETGIPLTTLTRRLGGYGKAFDIDELAAIAGLLDVSVFDLIGAADEAVPA